MNYMIHESYFLWTEEVLMYVFEYTWMCMWVCVSWDVCMCVCGSWFYYVKALSAFCHIFFLMIMSWSLGNTDLVCRLYFLFLNYGLFNSTQYLVEVTVNLFFFISLCNRTIAETLTYFIWSLFLPWHIFVSSWIGKELRTTGVSCWVTVFSHCTVQ